MSYRFNVHVHVSLSCQMNKIVVEHGIAVITREGADPAKFIHTNDFLWKNSASIVGCA